MNLPLEHYLEILNKENATYKEKRLIEKLINENNWGLLPSEIKQKKRKAAISYITRLSDEEINLKYEESIVAIYDLGNEVLLKINNNEMGVLNRLWVLITIQQALIDEYNIDEMDKIRKVDISVIENIINEIKGYNFDFFENLKLGVYLNLFNNIWYTKRKQ